MDLEGIVLSEIRQTEKDKHHMISYVESKKQKKETSQTEALMDTENKRAVSRLRRAGGWE